MTSFERFVSETENLALNSLICFNPVKRFENRNDMLTFWSSSDRRVSRTKNKLKTVYFSNWKIKQKKVVRSRL